KRTDRAMARPPRAAPLIPIQRCGFSREEGGRVTRASHNLRAPHSQLAIAASRNAGRWHRAPCSTHEAGFSARNLEAHGDGALSGVTRDGESFAFISVPASFDGDMPLTRTRIPCSMPEASL